MTVAVKDTESSPRLFDRLALECFAGMGYVLASLWLIFYGVSSLWRSLFGLDKPVSISLMILAMVVVAGLCAFGAVRLAGTKPRPGRKAGVAFGLLSVLSIVMLTSWVGGLLEPAVENPAVGMGITAALGLGLLGWLVWAYCKPNFEATLSTVEEQGWFQAEAYKKTQGMRVRRGTMLALLILAGCGIYTLLSHRTLVSGPPDWEVPIPFTGQVEVVRPNDAANLRPEDVLSAGRVLSAAEAEQIKNDLLAGYVRVTNAGDSDLKANEVITERRFKEVDQQLRDQKRLPPTKSDPVPPEVKPYPRITLLPHLVFTVPIVLALGALWLSYRLVNYPTFADFLIATEAELNKVSWTTRKRLFQDTVVVLMTVLLLTTFLFVVDQLWALVLTRIGVLNLPQETQTTRDREVPW